MYNPISCDFFDQLNVAMQRKIPSTIIYLENETNEEQFTLEGIVKTMEVVDGKEFLVLETKEKVRLDLVIKFNGRRHRED
ncbi:transcriptional antiterminator Rof [Poseidonibacter lekithochrous]|uniref:transcriptional antiterminator Rof n=1 Tax=Poseidonibacter lekithochrous TaxID=1904463 RepID=UPI0008FC3B57|nr:transcriptional antiterminator Rof [Poseidonibacter lekithochrous]QKJ22656.1 hypothetical protein ALEK_1382 [Poseidonibacter lekithochrous]